MSISPSRTALTAVTLAASVVTSCLTATTAQAATGGAAADGAYAFTARLETGDGLSACSAVLIAPQWLATSARCFAGDSGTGEATAGTPPGRPRPPSAAPT